ncbi:MAG TPA: head GIN domain-containing protein [Phnomibacter sp.]|nr:head GIN domain-containing protein [Phnomibacter sp.]
MKLLQWSLVILMQLGIFQSQAQTTINDPNVELRSTGAFNSIVVSSAIDLVVTQNSKVAVAVSASDPKYVANITTEVKDNTLYIGYKGSGSWGPKYMRAYVSAPTLYRMAASGACNIKTEGEFKGQAMEISLSGSSDFKGAVQVTSLKLSASGSSDIVISGTAVNLKVDVNGSSDLKGFELVTDYGDISASGASDVSITVNKELKVKASGASDVFYKGSGVIKEISASGSSDIKKRE